MKDLKTVVEGLRHGVDLLQSQWVDRDADESVEVYLKNMRNIVSECVDHLQNKKEACDAVEGNSNEGVSS